MENKRKENVNKSFWQKWVPVEVNGIKVELPLTVLLGIIIGFLGYCCFIYKDRTPLPSTPPPTYTFFPTYTPYPTYTLSPSPTPFPSPLPTKTPTPPGPFFLPQPNCLPNQWKPMKFVKGRLEPVPPFPSSAGCYPEHLLQELGFNIGNKGEIRINLEAHSGQNAILAYSFDIIPQSELSNITGKTLWLYIHIKQIESADNNKAANFFVGFSKSHHSSILYKNTGFFIVFRQIGTNKNKILVCRLSGVAEDCPPARQVDSIVLPLKENYNIGFSLQINEYMEIFLDPFPGDTEGFESKWIFNPNKDVFFIGYYIASFNGGIVRTEIRFDY